MIIYVFDGVYFKITAAGGKPATPTADEERAMLLLDAAQDEHGNAEISSVGERSDILGGVTMYYIEQTFLYHEQNQARLRAALDSLKEEDHGKDS